MDKQKIPPGPRPRVKRTGLPPPPGDFIALGKSSAVKPRTPGEVEAKPIPAATRKSIPGSGSSSGITAQKRKETIPINPVPPKQPRTFSPFSGGSKETIPSKTLDIGEPAPAVKIIDAAFYELEELVLNADSIDDIDLVDGLVCGAIKNLKANRLKPDPMLYLTLSNLAKINYNIFTSKRVVEQLLQFLRRETSISGVKPKPNTLLSIMTCNILLHAFQYEETWPHSFMKVYVEDALGDRAWVDNEANKDFVNNIIAVFGTQLPAKPATQQPISTFIKTESSGGLVTQLQGTSSSTKNEEERILEEQGITLEANENISIQNRYAQQKDEAAIQAYIHEVVKDQLNKRQMIDSVSRNLLRFLTCVCGYTNVRLLASQRLETWLQNPKLARPAQELLMSVAKNCNTNAPEDSEVIANIVRMRLKSKPVNNQYVNAIKELITHNTENLGAVLKHVIYNELSQQRNPSNMAVLGVIFMTEPDQAAKCLSHVFLELLANREDYLRALRALFREIVRSLKFEANLVEFCRGLMQERKDSNFVELEQPLRERMYWSVIDLICLGMFLCISPIVKEQGVSLTKGEKRDYSVLQSFQSQISTVQRDAVWFFHVKVTKMYMVGERDFVLGLKRVLFLESNDQYNTKDNWPPEGDKNIFLQLVREVPLAEDGLLRLHLLGLSEELPINCADTLDLIERMVLRAAMLRGGLQGLEVERPEVLKMLLSLSAYTHPRDIQLPQGYEPPNLTISNLYWKTWLILTVLAATNPTTVGLEVWENYPTARCLMEMLITGCYEFPPLNVGDQTCDEIKGKELQICRAEKDDIIVFEGHLAAATSRTVISESNSLLISQLLYLDPTGPPRQPPKYIIERLKTLNETIKLGKLLCLSRDPDFLLSIIQCQSSSTSMPWLADLVQSSENNLNSLPVQCLCEFLLMNHSHNNTLHNRHKSIKPKVASRLQELLMGVEATPQSSTDLIKYFIERWSSPEMSKREASIDGFQSIILLQRKYRESITAEDDLDDEGMKTIRRSMKMHIVKDESFSWLHEKFPNIPYFEESLKSVLDSLLKSLSVESNISRLKAYILFLSKYHKDGDPDFFSNLTNGLAYLIRHRYDITKKVLHSLEHAKDQSIYFALLDLFGIYLENQLNSIASDDDEDNQEAKKMEVFVSWTGTSQFAGKSATLRLRYIQASLALLAYEDCDVASYKFLMEIWSAKENFNVKKNGKDYCVFDDDWLKFVLVKSKISVLCDAVLERCDPKELISFLSTSGIPIQNISKILHHLDELACNDSSQILEIGKDNDHLLREIEMVRSCGAEGGKDLCELLDPNYKQNKTANFNLENITMDLKDININIATPKQSRKDEKGKEARRKSPQKTVMQYTKEDIVKILTGLFLGTNKKISKYITFKQRLLISSISSKNETAELLNMAIMALAEVTSDEDFTKTFISNKKESLPLLKLLFAYGSKTLLLKCVDNLRESLDADNEFSSSFTALCRKYKLEKEAGKSTKSCNAMITELLKSKSNDASARSDLVQAIITKISKETTLTKLSKDKVIGLCVYVARESPAHFEKLIQALFLHLKNQKNSPFLLEVLVEVLKAVDEPMLGLVIDWLSIFDSEVTHIKPVLQRELLFTKPTDHSVNSNTHKTAFLMSLLAHDTKASTLQDCLTWLLGDARDIDTMNATSCLDVINSLFNNPRLWQGREDQDVSKELSEKNQFGNVQYIRMDIHFDQLYRLTELIVAEVQELAKDTEFATKMEDASALLEKRLPLLLLLSKRSIGTLRRVIKWLQQRNTFRQDVFEFFLQHIYLRKPNLLEKDMLKENIKELPKGCSTEIDNMLHQLILSIGEPQGNVEWEKKFEAISSINRRLALQHPLIFTRQLPLLLSIIKGKSRMTSGNFQLSNQLMFCTHVLELFDLLRENFFQNSEESRDIMSYYIDVFLELIMSNCLKQDTRSVILNKVVEFTNRYIASGSGSIAHTLRKHEITFRGLMYDYPNFEGLITICTYMKVPPSQSTMLAADTTPWNEVQLSSFKKRLNVNHHISDLDSALRDLDESSKRRVDILQYFMEELSSLTSYVNESIRDQAYMLMLRHYKRNPNGVQDLVKVLLQNLNSDDCDIIHTASKHASQVLMLCAENCEIVINKMFEISSRGKLDLEENILATIKNFNCNYETR